MIKETVIEIVVELIQSDKLDQALSFITSTSSWEELEENGKILQISQSLIDQGKTEQAIAFVRAISVESIRTRSSEAVAKKLLN